MQQFLVLCWFIDAPAYIYQYGQCDIDSTAFGTPVPPNGKNQNTSRFLKFKNIMRIFQINAIILKSFEGTITNFINIFIDLREPHKMKQQNVIHLEGLEFDSSSLHTNL